MCFVLWVLPVDQAVLWIKMEAPNQNENINLKFIVLIKMQISLLHPWTEALLAQQVKLFCKISRAL